MRTNCQVARLLAPAFLGLVAGTANADFLGWTATSRSVSGGYIVNVFAVTNSATDSLFNVYGSNPSSPNAGYVRTNAAGGFRQGTGLQSVFAADGLQASDTLDSFLTVGAFWDAASGIWYADNATIGDPAWNVTYTAGATTKTANSFNVRSNTFPHPNFTNPNTASVPATAGWYLTGSSAQACDLSVLTSRVASSNAAAAAGAYGMMVAQLYVSQLDLDWKMGATIGRADGSASQGTFSLQICPRPVRWHCSAWPA